MSLIAWIDSRRVAYLSPAGELVMADLNAPAQRTHIAGAFTQIATTNRTLIAAGHDRICLFAPENGFETRRISLDDELIIGLAADSDHIAALTQRGTAYQWRADTGEVRASVVLASSPGWADGFALSAQPFTVIAASGHPSNRPASNRIALHHAGRTSYIEAGTPPITLITLSGDDETFATATGPALDYKRDTRIHVYTIAEPGAPPRHINAHADQITALISHQSALYSGDASGALYRHDSAGSARLDAFDAPIHKLSAAGDVLAAAALDGTIRVYDAQTGAQITRHTSADGVRALLLAPDARALAVLNASGAVDITGLAGGPMT